MDQVIDPSINPSIDGLLERVPLRLVPIAGTSCRSWHPSTGSFLRECVRRVTESAGASSKASHVSIALLSQWVSSLDIAMWKQNVAMLRRCVPGMEVGALDRPWSDGSAPLCLLLACCVTCDEHEEV